MVAITPRNRVDKYFPEYVNEIGGCVDKRVESLRFVSFSLTVKLFVQIFLEDGWPLETKAERTEGVTERRAIINSLGGEEYYVR